MKKLLLILLLLFPVHGAWGDSLKDYFGKGKELLDKGKDKAKDVWEYDIDKILGNETRKQMKHLDSLEIKTLQCKYGGIGDKKYSYQECKKFKNEVKTLRNILVEKGVLESYEEIERKNKRWEEERKGEYAGIGTKVKMEDGLIKVYKSLENGPAYKAGIRVGDYITHLDEKSVLGLDLDEAIDIMKGPVGSELKVSIKRSDQEQLDLIIQRDIIKISSFEPKKEESKEKSNVSKSFDTIFLIFIYGIVFLIIFVILDGLKITTFFEGLFKLISERTIPKIEITEYRGLIGFAFVLISQYVYPVIFYFAIVVCLGAIYFSYKAYKKNDLKWTYIFGAMAVLYNPIFPIIEFFLISQYGLWFILNILSAIFIYKYLEKTSKQPTNTDQ